MTENQRNSKISLVWNRFKGWWDGLRHKQAAAEEIVQADHAEMVWADDGGQINPIPTDGAGETQPGETQPGE